MTKLYSKVYILILNYNGWQDTTECLESVFRNDYPNYQDKASLCLQTQSVCQVIVVDNGSANNSMEYIKKWAEGKQEVYMG